MAPMRAADEWRRPYLKKLKASTECRGPWSWACCHDKSAQPYSNNTVIGVEFHYSLGQPAGSAAIDTWPQ